MKKFLDNYDTIIFDMDGVMTNEQNYWNSAALTVWEYIRFNRNERTDPSYCMKNYWTIRSQVFCDDKLITILKSKGVNSNWDLGYVTVLMAWICFGIHGDIDFKKVLEYAENLSENILDEYENLAEKCSQKTGFDFEWLRRNGLMWTTMRDIFQEWFLGDDAFFEQYGRKPLNSGKSGLLDNEQPIISLDKIKSILSGLSKNKHVGMATGRPHAEIVPLLEKWDIKKYFDSDKLCDYDFVAKTQKNLNNNSLAKPHPYMFLKALYGLDYPDRKIISGEYDIEKIKTTLIVGDAGADILAAHAMGADFCAVLTGVQGKKARRFFEESKSEYIFDSIEEFLED